MKKFSFSQLLKEYSAFKNSELKGRYLTHRHLEPELKKLSSAFTLTEIGRSHWGNPIHSISIGKGPVKIFGWSQMHGNESTTTKALFDLFRLFETKSQTEEISDILNTCTLKFIPMLNPDGAMKYTRENSNSVDLNRDADMLTQKESQILRSCFEDFKPHFCFNLHDQRTIFSAGKNGKPATISFLAPAMDEDRKVNEVRAKAMKTIVAMNKVLQEFIPGQVGRYDDAFNINCSGDKFQSSGVPTILFEAGHYPGDYEREETRKFITVAMLAGIISIASGTLEKQDRALYESIPENQKEYYDIILRNSLIEGKLMDVAIQYEEKLREGNLNWDPIVQLIDQNLPFIGHRTIDCRGLKVLLAGEEPVRENVLAAGILLNRDNISLKIE